MALHELEYTCTLYVSYITRLQRKRIFITVLYMNEISVTLGINLDKYSPHICPKCYLVLKKKWKKSSAQNQNTLDG